MSDPRSRLIVVCFAFSAIFSVFSYRLIQIQYVQHEKYVEMAAEKHKTKVVIHAARGLIYDARGEILAANIPVKTVVADASRVNDPEQFSAIAGDVLDLPSSEIAGKLATGRRYIVLKRRVSEADAAKLQERLAAAGVKGLQFEQEAVRSYPNASALCHVLGYTNFDYAGVDGVEKTMDRFLRGEDGYRRIEHDRTGKELVIFRGREQPPKNGLNLQLTIDMGLQHIVEQELEAAYAHFKPKSATAIFMRPATGEILALANRPAFDPNAVGASEVEHRRNVAIADMVEPGSTFKIVAVGAALNDKLVRPDTKIFCENGRFHYGGRVLRDHHPYGFLSVHDIIVKSSNIGSAKLALQMGEQRYYDAVRRFGFGEKSGIELPGESAGLVHPPHRWDKLTITRMPMGHSVCATALQIVTAMGAVANGGTLMRPQIVKGILDEKGKTITEFPPREVRRVLSPEAAADLRLALADVVGARGTAREAAVEHFQVAGKTGTAQRVDPNGGYAPGKYVVSFVGFLPAEAPELVGLVILDDAVTSPGMNYGGLVAAPIFSKISSRAVRYLDLQPILQAEPVKKLASH
jgi:cell division protein FtsI (penicillin-binding protein 3)